jgi:hypothetical protein
MPPPKRSLAALRYLPKKILKHSLGWRTHVRLFDFGSGDQATLESLPQSLAQERALNAIGLYQIEDGPQRPSILEALRRLQIIGRDIRVVKH